MYVVQLAVSAIAIFLSIFCQILISSILIWIGSITSNYDFAVIPQFGALVAFKQFVVKSNKTSTKRFINFVAIAMLVLTHAMSFLVNYLLAITGHIVPVDDNAFISFEDRVDTGGQSFYDGPAVNNMTTTGWLYRQLPNFNDTALSEGYNINYNVFPEYTELKTPVVNCTDAIQLNDTLVFCTDSMYTAQYGAGVTIKQTNKTFEFSNLTYSDTGFESVVINAMMSIQSGDALTSKTRTVLYNSAAMAYNIAGQTGSTGLSGGAGTSIVYTQSGNAIAYTIKLMKFVCSNHDCLSWNASRPYWRNVSTQQWFATKELGRNQGVVQINDDLTINIITNYSAATNMILSYTSIMIDTSVLQGVAGPRDLSGGGWAQTALCRPVADPLMETNIAYTTGFYFDNENDVNKFVNLQTWIGETIIDKALYNISSSFTMNCGVWATKRNVMYAADASLRSVIIAVVVVCVLAFVGLLCQYFSIKHYKIGVLQLIASMTVMSDSWGITVEKQRILLSGYELRVVNPDTELLYVKE